MQINKRPLSSSGLEIATVGFGAWAIGGGGWSVRELTSPVGKFMKLLEKEKP